MSDTFGPALMPSRGSLILQLVFNGAGILGLIVGQQMFGGSTVTVLALSVCLVAFNAILFAGVEASADDC